jgi:threonine synthase
MAVTTGRKGDIHGQRPAERRDLEVARAMAAAARSVGVTGRILVTQPTHMGAHVVDVNGDSNAVISGLAIGVEALNKENALMNTTQAAATTAAASTAAAAPVGGASSSSSSAVIVACPSAASSSYEAGHPATSWLGDLYESPSYVSTRDTSASPKRLSFADVVFAGLAPDGGLYAPVGALPRVEPEFLQKMRSWPYYAVAARVLSLLVGPDQIPFVDLLTLCRNSYGKQWDSPQIAPVVSVPALVGSGSDGSAASGNILVAEHFHGPTCAFKDLALQLLGNLFEYLLQRNRKSGAQPQRLTILGATSGDTGSAAIQGVRGKEGIDVYILHPQNRVAAVQEAQMTSVLDSNVHNVAVARSDFDACQAVVKGAFSDAAFRERHSLSAVNSINWARILGQVVYSFWTYLRFADAKGIATITSESPSLDVVVPTGNFGNALSVYYARRMGVPLASVCVATNANSIVHGFVSSGEYKLNPVVPTLAPSMDISVASNIERLWYHLAGDSSAQVQTWLAELASTRKIASFTPAQLDVVRSTFSSAAADDATIDTTVRTYLAGARYALCPHTACGMHAVAAIPALRASAAAGNVCVYGTAHPAKFASSTPALAEAGLYFREVEGASAKPVVAVSEPLAAAYAGVLPALPEQLLGLADRPRLCATLPNSREAVQSFLDSLSKSK